MSSHPQFIVKTSHITYKCMVSLRYIYFYKLIRTGGSDFFDMIEIRINLNNIVLIKPGVR